jgi:signal transduction histidine kinase/ligand-binding sensor domain-containing protein
MVQITCQRNDFGLQRTPQPGNKLPWLGVYNHDVRLITAVLMMLACGKSALALDPRKALSQYSRTVWTQERGLPQDTVRAITQTKDGYLWLGTDEGLARFDGYDFVVFNKTKGNLPNNSVTALAASNDGALWVGTQNGLVEYREGVFRTYTTKDGLPDASIASVYADSTGALWVVAGVYLSRYQNGKFTSFEPEMDIPVTSMRAACTDRHGNLWVAGFSRVAKRVGNKFVTFLTPGALEGVVVLTMMVDQRDNVWVGTNSGAIELTADGAVRKFGVGEGLPDTSVRALWADRDGNIWGGTNRGVVRLEGGRFLTAEVSAEAGGDLVRCLFEDREGNLWIGTNGGLVRWRNDIFTVYGKAEGLPSDEPNIVYQDRAGHVWIGFNDAGLMLFSGGPRRTYSAKQGLPDSAIMQIREASNGDLLLCTRRGMARLSGGAFQTYKYPDPLSRRVVFDALETSDGKLWLALPRGLGVLSGGEFHEVIPGGPFLGDFMLTLCQANDGSIWAGSSAKGLWHVRGDERKQFTTSDGLSSDQIRSIYQDAQGTIWIATFGGGLNALRDGKFTNYREQNGLLSDNIGKIADDGDSLWLSTTRGICRVAKRQFAEMDSGSRHRLEPENYGVEDGLRSAQCAPGYPLPGGGTRARDGRLYFATSRGVAVLDPGMRKAPVLEPMAHIVEMTANNQLLDLREVAQLAPGKQRLEIRYTGIHLSAPDRVQYSYRLDPLDSRWADVGSRRVIDYNNLPHGQYRFHMKAELPGAVSEQSYSFEVLPQFWETAWFRVLAAAALGMCAWAAYQVRLRQIRSRFAAVLEERARLAREIHDTLAQGFVGISSQLDAVAMSMPSDSSTARTYLDLARRMARHSLTEARRSVMDLRASALEGQDLAAAIQSGTRMWTAGSGVDVEVEIEGSPAQLPEEMEQHLLRITQEAVTNVLKHAGAHRIWVKLHREARKLYLRVVDDGRGFDEKNAFSSRGGHFGLIGMRERAERMGGELRLASHPGEGTELEVSVPLP